MGDLKELEDMIDLTTMPNGRNIKCHGPYYDLQKEIIINTLKPNDFDFLVDYLLKEENKSDVLCINIGCGYHEHYNYKNRVQYENIGRIRFYQQFTLIEGLISKFSFDEYKEFKTNYVLIDPQFKECIKNTISILSEYELYIIEKIGDDITVLKSRNKEYINLTIYVVTCGFFMGNLITRYYSKSQLYIQKLVQFKRLLNNYLETGCVLINTSLKFFGNINLSEDGFFFKDLEILLRLFIKENFNQQKRLIFSEFNLYKNTIEIIYPIEQRKDINFPECVTIGKKNDNTYDITINVRKYEENNIYSIKNIEV
jgi:hypothetical protein